MLKSWIYCLLLLLFGSCQIAYATTEQNLQQVNTQIQTLKTHLSQERRIRNSQQTKLENIEIQMGHLSVRLDRSKQQLAEQRRNLRRLATKQRHFQQELKRQRQTLAVQVRAAYLMGKQGHLKMLLNQRNPAEVSRINVYYRYFIRHRAQLIDKISHTLVQLRQNKQRIDTHRQQLQRLQAQLDRERSQQIDNRLYRQSLVTELNAEIRNKWQRLKILQENKKHLKQVIRHIEKTGLGFIQSSSLPFRRLRGKLAWPIRGKVVRSFGVRIESSQLKSQGILIAAAEDRNVYAIARGRVVFAKWMPGYGLLLIISHGQGYMTIYGRNGSLYAKVGNVVRAGQKIATVGQSGGYAKPGLYFSVRHDGIAMNPGRWCKTTLPMA